MCKSIAEKQGSDGLAMPYWLELSAIQDPFGTLCYGQVDSPLPFKVQRFFYIYGIPDGALRGGHAHRETHEAVFCIRGNCVIRVYSRDGKSRCFTLNIPNRGVYLPPMWWVVLEEFTSDPIILALASNPYSEKDYLRDPDDFFNEKPYPFSKSDR